MIDCELSPVCSCYDAVMDEPSFEWDEEKDFENQQKHGVSFYEAQFAFLDSNRLIAEDLEHSQNEKRYFCFGTNRDGSGI